MGFFEVIVQFFERIWDTLTNIFAMLAYAVGMVTAGVGAMNGVFMLMPAVIGACALTSMAVLVIRFLLMK